MPVTPNFNYEVEKYYSYFAHGRTEKINCIFKATHNGNRLDQHYLKFLWTQLLQHDVQIEFDVIISLRKLSCKSTSFTHKKKCLLSSDYQVDSAVENLAK